MKYKVIESEYDEDLDAFIKRVNDAMKEGWLTTGGIAIAAYPGYGPEDTQTIFIRAQAMLANE